MSAVETSMPELAPDVDLFGRTHGIHSGVGSAMMIRPCDALPDYYEIAYVSNGRQFASPPIAGSRVNLWMEKNNIVATGLLWSTKPHVPATQEPRRYVYFITDEDGYIKIGSAFSVNARLAQLQTSARQTLRLIGTIPGSIADEKVLHARFAHARVRGEWFRPTDDLTQFVEAAVTGGHR